MGLAVLSDEVLATSRREKLPADGDSPEVTEEETCALAVAQAESHLRAQGPAPLPHPISNPQRVWFSF